MSIVTPEGVIRALERTLATGSARVVVVIQTRILLPVGARDMAGRSRRRGGVLRRARRSARALARPLLACVPPGARMTIMGRGFVDFGRRRAMVAYGRESVIVVDGEARSGPPGLPVPAAPARPAAAMQDPTWLLNAAYGVTAVEARRAEPVAGEPCRRVRIVCDLSRAAAATPPELPLPVGVERFEDLLHVPLDVWLDRTERIRRVRHESRDGVTMTLDLLQLGIALPEDWSRLPRSERR